MIFLLFIPYAALLAVYCLFEWKKDFLVATILKLVVSAFASITAFVAAIILGSFVLFIFAFGLLLAVPADYFLQFLKRDKKKYTLSMLLFGAMNVCLLLSFYIKWSVSFWEFIFWLAFVLTLVLLVQSEKLKISDSNQLTIYSALITFMAAKAISVAIVSFSGATFMLAFGGLCFLAADLLLRVWEHYGEKFRFLLLSRSIYFVGQMSLAFCLLLMI